MELLSVSSSFPSRIVSNNEIIDLVLEESKEHYSGNLKNLSLHVTRCLEFCGAVERRWLSNHEKPLEHIECAVDKALSKASLSKADVDLIIYSSVDRGLLEPGDSYVVAHALGFDRVMCFDVLDACNGWIRALDIANSFIMSGRVNCVLIVNAEFPVMSGKAIYPFLYRINRSRELAHRFPGFTIGEVATATLVSKSPHDNWEFWHRSRPDLVEECTVALDGFEERYFPSSRIAIDGPQHFSSFGKKLFKNVSNEMEALHQEAALAVKTTDVFLPHSASHKLSIEIAKHLGISDKLISIFPEYGNMISASVPAALSIAARRGDIKVNDRVMCCVGSAGMSFSLTKFKYLGGSCVQQ